MLLYELLCNRQHPYWGAKPMVDEDIIDSKTVRADLDQELAAFVSRACASDRDQRFATATEMEAELRTIRPRCKAFASVASNAEVDDPRRTGASSHRRPRLRPRSNWTADPLFC